MFFLTYLTVDDEVREVYWIGSSKDDLKKFPDDVRREVGYILWLVQHGSHHQRGNHGKN